MTSRSVGGSIRRCMLRVNPKIHRLYLDYPVVVLPSTDLHKEDAPNLGSVACDRVMWDLREKGNVGKSPVDCE